MSAKQQEALDWSAAAQIVPGTSEEPLVPASPCPHWITWPVYYKQGLAGALPEVWLRQGVYDRLLLAARALPGEVQLVLLDGWRPKSVQMQLFEDIRQQVALDNPGLEAAEVERITLQFAARPSDDRQSPSPHITGGSVDVTLADREGRMLDMGSRFDEPSERSWTAADVGAAQRQRRRMLADAMGQAGFTNLPSEWWHFDYGNWVWAWYSDQPAALYGPASLA